MTPELLAALFSPDLNCSPEARSLIAHVATLGAAEIPYPRLMRLLQVSDEKKLRRAIAEAEDAGWIAVERQTGKGHHPRFTFTPPKNGTLSDKVPKNGSLKPDRVPENGRVNGAPSSPTSPSPSSAREALNEGPTDDLSLARLRQALHPYDEVLDRLRRSTGTSSWAADVWGWYAPPDEGGKNHGTQWLDFASLNRDEALQALSIALGDYASEGKAWDRRLFRGFARKAGREARKARASREREEQEVETPATVSTRSTTTPLSPEVQEWADRIGAALQLAIQENPGLVEWVEATEEHLWKLNQDDREFQRMRPGEQAEQIRLYVLNAYGQKIGEPARARLSRSRRVAGR